ncbi:hypothetical protein T11_16504 [Trichinella zimbabwensis]|uniref:Uncharacterized protein n=1 Tax=Trichinella zimbabwensis TaxID=268475 RepID=A0A0V1GT68_9BILA|nr:hypothetical protein T11_16504 [Trichinella zimbabwensis]
MIVKAYLCSTVIYRLILKNAENWEKFFGPPKISYKGICIVPFSIFVEISPQNCYQNVCFPACNRVNVTTLGICIVGNTSTAIQCSDSSVVLDRFSLACFLRLLQGVLQQANKQERWIANFLFLQED